MTDDQRSLWRRLERFSFDDPAAASLPLRARLARDNGWTLAYTGRVLEEYRRFAFLAICAGHPVTPSDQVDQAWHLHLLYTRSYWEEFCPEVLRQPLHHGPTRGGKSEGQKFGDWYARTLAGYRRFFGEEPPADLWPPARVRFGRDMRFVRVNVHDHWVLPKPVWLLTTFRRALPWAAAGVVVAVGLRVTAVLAATPASSSTSLGGFNGLNPLDFRGPEFLTFYVSLMVLAIVAALLVRAIIKRTTPAPPGGETAGGDGPELGILETALLIGGEPRAVETALVALERNGALTLTDQGEFTQRPDQPARVSGADSPLERALYAGVRETGRVSALRQLGAVRGAVADLENVLVQRGLFLPESAWNASRRGAALLAAIPLLPGVAKIMVGLERGRPVGFLVMLCLLTAFLAFKFWRTTGRRTPRGDALRRGIQDRHRELKTPAAAAVPSATAATASAAMLVLGVAVFGASALPGEELRPLRQAIAPPDGSSGGDSGSSGDSGGSCGGGGCGGCGGGGD